MLNLNENYDRWPFQRLKEVDVNAALFRDGGQTFFVGCTRSLHRRPKKNRLRGRQLVSVHPSRYKWRL